MDHANTQGFRTLHESIPLQAAILFELIEALENSEATHLVLDDQPGEGRQVPVATFLEDCRRNGRRLQQQLARRN